MSHQSEAVLNKNIESLLRRAKTIVNHQTEVSKLLGENFNVFSILGMEKAENKTHSAFIQELLNPKGSHQKGGIFLNLFLKQINYSKIAVFDIESAKTTVEYHISKRDDKNKTGGRVDILISDKLKNTICIENKIDAGDQESQIERYVNYNKNKNTVYYLTKEGSSASEASKGELVESEDYHCISYRETIINWLEQCMKESADQPILRESIKQYIILVKKLTNQLTDSTMASQIEELIIKNYKAAKVIQNNIKNAESAAVELLLEEIVAKLKIMLSEEDWDIDIDDNAPSGTYCGVWIRHMQWQDDIWIQYRGEPRIAYDKSMIGVHAKSNQFNREEIDKRLSSTRMYGEGHRQTRYYPCYEFVLDLTDDKKREQILFDEEHTINFVNELADKMVALAKETEKLLQGIKPKKK
jgi:hypothetical protein